MRGKKALFPREGKTFPSFSTLFGLTHKSHHFRRVRSHIAPQSFVSRIVAAQILSLFSKFDSLFNYSRTRFGYLILRACSPTVYFQFSSIQFNSVQISSDQFSSALDNTFTLIYHYSFQFSLVQFSSVQISSDRIRSVQFSSIQFSSAVLCQREQALHISI